MISPWLSYQGSSHAFLFVECSFEGHMFAPFRCFLVQFSTNRSPGIFLTRVTKGLPPLKTKYAVTIVNQEHPDKSIFRGKASKSLKAMCDFGG